MSARLMSLSSSSSTSPITALKWDEEIRMTALFSQVIMECMSSFCMSKFGVYCSVSAVQNIHIFDYMDFMGFH